MTDAPFFPSFAKLASVMGDPILTGILVIVRKKRKEKNYGTWVAKRRGTRADLLQVRLPVFPGLALFRVPLARCMATR
jgi:hypothetical protein